jgi:TatD DNase family protein
MEDSDVSTLAEMSAHPKVVAIGEIGLDFYRNYSPRPAQLRALKWQLDLAQKLMLPVAIHCRQAEADMVPILKDWTSSYKVQSPGVIHCFSNDSGDAGQYLDMGFYLALGAYIGYPSMKGMHGIIRDIPEDRLLVETDCPFRPPQSYRGRRNEPSYIPIVVETLAGIRGESPEAIARKTTQNARNLFRIKD